MRMVVTSRRGGFSLLALVAVAIGAVLVVVALRGQQSAPQPPRSVGSIDAAGSSASPSPHASSSPATHRHHRLEPVSVGRRPLGASRPVSLTIPAIGVQTPVQALGLAADGTLAVPQPGPHLNQAAWFDKSPTPGQPGPAIIEGHVDSDAGPSVFFQLGRIRPGDLIRVTRADGSQLTFTVDGVRDYPKATFPTQVVYGGDLRRPQLRLITCSDFDASIGHHVANEVVFSHLTAVHQPASSHRK